MEEEEQEVRGHRWRSGLDAQRLYVMEEVVGMPLPDLHHIDISHRGGVLEYLLEGTEVDRVILAEERGRLPQQAPTSDDLLPRE
jgi:hypothetical protein